MTALEFLKSLHRECAFQTREGKKVGPASNRELERWFANRAVIINGSPANAKDELEFPLQNMVLFPKNPVTLWDAKTLDM